jgi:hypothetical protein
VVIPSSGATLSGKAILDAFASDPAGVSKVEFHVTGGTVSNQLVATATPTIYGWLAQWNTTTVPDGTYTLQSVAFDAIGFSAPGTGITITVHNTPTTAVTIPSNGATQSGGGALLDAIASANVNNVNFYLNLPNSTQLLIGNATPTIYGWLGSWNTTTVPNGAYTIQSFATDTSDGLAAFSAPVSITVSNPPPSTKVLIPSNGATQAGGAALLDAGASANVSSVSFELTGGILSNQVIATATPTIYGWLASWNTSSVANGTYTLQSVASYPGGVSGTSSPITITVAN